MTTRVESYRNHARAMAEAEHKPECERRVPDWLHARDMHFYFTGYDDPGPRPEPCPGCITDDERELWRRLADEADEYLGRQP